MMKVGFYGHVRQYNNVKSEIDAALAKVLESGQYVMGPAVSRFEKELAAFHGMQNAIGVNSGTDALWLVLMGLGVGPGDEVITTSNTFFATAEAIWIAGATAVFVDSEPKTNNIDVTKIEAAISPKTKAIIPVHLYGQCAEMDKVAAIAKKHKLFVIEDNAQSLDAAGANFKIGEHSDAVCTSFIIQKNLGCFGDGGAVITNNKDLASEVLRMRNHGSLKRSVHSYGFNSRLDDIHAAVLSVKLKHIHAWNNQRQKYAARYTAGLKGLALTLPHELPGYRHVYHLYVVEPSNGKRDAMLSFLNEQGVDAKCHYPIMITQQKGSPWGKEARICGSLEHSERNAARCVSLPMYPELTKEEVDFTIAKVIEWCKANA